MDAREIDRRARAIWDNIADENGSRRGHAAKIARLYGVCRDLQIAKAEGAKVSLWDVLMLIGAVVRGSR